MILWNRIYWYLIIIESKQKWLKKKKCCWSIDSDEEYDESDEAMAEDGSQMSYPVQWPVLNTINDMGGVNWGDQYRGYYHVRMKCRKFYKYIINFLFDVTITNSFILYNISHNRKMKSLKFWEMLALELIGNYCTRKRAGRGRSRTIRSLPMLHFPARFQTDHGHKRGKCALCRENKKRMDIQWFCKECDVWLCHTGTEHDCFLSWHQKN